MLKKIKNKTAEAFVGAGIKILIAVIIGALLLTATYALTKDTVMPTAKEKIEELFDYSQGSGGQSVDTLGYAVFSDGATLSWEELMSEENGAKYGYSADKITETSIERNAFQECIQLTDIVINDGVVSIGTNAFGSCENLKSVFMPNSVSALGEGVFNYCYQMKDVTLSQGITTISKRLFKECGSLKTLVIPDSVTTICQNAFYDCVSLESITMSSNLETIEGMAFYEASSLKEINLPVSITSLKWGAFTYSFVTDFYYEGSKAQWNAIDKNNWAQYLSGYTVHCSDGDI